MFKTMPLLVLSLFLLSACAGKMGVLPETYKDQTINTTLYNNVVGVSAEVPQTQIHSGGILGALVASIATEVSRQKRITAINLMKSSFTEKELLNLMGGQYENALKQAKWVNVKGAKNFGNTSYSDLKGNVKLDSDEISTETITLISSNILLDPFYKNLKQTMSLRINKFENGKLGSNIYTLDLLSSYSQPEIFETEEEFADINMWMKNNRLHLKNGIKATTVDIQKQMKEYFKNPFSSTSIQ